MEEGQNQDQQSTEAAPIATVKPTTGGAHATVIPPPSGKKGNKALRIVIILAVLIGLGAGGWFLLKEPSFDEATNDGETLSAQSTPTTETTPTPKPVDKSEVAIEILNGTGIEGEASFLKGKFISLGFEKIEVANADSQDSETTTVTFSSDLDSAVREEIVNKLEDIYQKVTTKTSGSLSADLLIVTGLRKGQTPKPSPTATPEATASPTPDPSGSPSSTPTESPISSPTT